MRNVLERAALAAWATAVLSASSWAQTSSTDPAHGERAAMAASAAEASAPPAPDGTGLRPPVLGTRAPSGAPGVRPQAPTDTTPTATVQTPSTRPRTPADPDARGIVVQSAREWWESLFPSKVASR
ncbi:MAG TPA: hypothetical protein VMU47_02125 [Caldimonas sp.]|nr:hypothetical protein [Caldimonas sp.]